MARVPTSSPATRANDPVNSSPATNDPDVIVYSSAGSASPYVFDAAVAVTVIARSITVIVCATEDAAL